MKLAELFEQHLDEITRRGFLKGAAAVGAAAMASKAKAVLPKEVKVDVDEMAKRATRRILEQDFCDKYEYIVLILANGRLTKPHTDHQKNQVRVPTPASGVEVLATVHNHPREKDRSSRRPVVHGFSVADRQDARQSGKPSYVYFGTTDELRVYQDGDHLTGRLVASGFRETNDEEES